jgi:hypothetical protein
MSALVSRITLPVAIVAAAIVFGLAYDGAVLINHLQPTASEQTTKKDKAAKPNPPGKAKQPAKQRPCNHGFYVSQAARSKSGGQYVKQIAQSDLGKDGNCSAPLPSPEPTTKPTTSSEPEGD